MNNVDIVEQHEKKETYRISLEKLDIVQQRVKKWTLWSIMKKVDIAAAAWKQQSKRSSVEKGVIVEHHGNV